MSTKSFVINHLSTTLGVNKKEAVKIFSALASATFSSLANYGVAIIPGVGRLKLKHRPDRMGRNPKTGISISIPARNVLKLTASKSAKDKVNI